MNKYAVVFAGQGSQYIGMGKEFYEKYDKAKQIYSMANDILGYDLKKMCFEGDINELSKTYYAQSAIFSLSMIGFELLKEEEIEISAVAGFSLGEISSLVGAGCLSLEDGFKVVALRAKAMQEAAEKYGGVMYAILNTDAKIIEDVCNEIDGYVAPVNYNSPVQTVIAGEEQAVEQAVLKLTTDCGSRAIKLKVNAAFHSKMIESASIKFEQDIKDFEFKTPIITMYSDVTGDKNNIITPNYLKTQMISPVRWVDIVNNIINSGINNFIELGSGKTLCGLIKKIDKTATSYNIEDEKTLANFKESL